MLHQIRAPRAGASYAGCGAGALIASVISRFPMEKEKVMLKADPHPDYPPEDGRYLTGNDCSPVAVAIIHTVLLIL